MIPPSETIHTPPPSLSPRLVRRRSGAQLHANLQYPDPGHWSQQMDWHDDVDNYERTHVT
jgi:hypothetical protein